jgi:hypothetical protein
MARSLRAPARRPRPGSRRRRSRRRPGRCARSRCACSSRRCRTALLPACDRAVERHREHARERRLADTAGTAEEVGVADPVCRPRVSEGFGDVLLGRDVGEVRGAVFPGQGLMRHGLCGRGRRQDLGSVAYQTKAPPPATACLPCRGAEERVPQATRSYVHRTYRCYRRGPDGVGGLPSCGPGARFKPTGSPPEGQRHPGRQASSRWSTATTPSGPRDTATASKRQPRPGSPWCSHHQAATNSISARLRAVIASSGCPDPFPLRPFTSTKATRSPRRMTRSTSFRRNRTFRSTISQPRAASQRAATPSKKPPDAMSIHT